MPYEADAVSERYARALFEAASADPAQVDEQLGLVTADIHALRDLYESVPELQALFRSIAVPRPVRRRVLALLTADAEPLTRRFLERVEQNGRLPLLTRIADRYTALVFERLNLVRAVVRSARPLSAAQLEALRQRLTRRFGKKVIIRNRLAPKLLAGFVVQVGDRVIDCSVKGHLERLRERLLAG